MTSRSIFVALVGKPNVGKSSLMNRYLGEKIAIVTYKPQTTRARITGILTRDGTQFVFIDTPGVHDPRTKLGERMVSASIKALSDVDLVLMLFEPKGELDDAEKRLVDKIKSSNVTAIAAVNKADTAKDEEARAKAEQIEDLGVFEQVRIISATKGDGTQELLDTIESYAPEGPHFFDDDAITDMPEKDIAAEIVREKLLLNMRDEIPHGANVEVESFKERNGGQIIDIDVVIYCEKSSHKGMIIGKQGSMLKKIGTRARHDMETFLGTKVNLKCFVKVKEDWRDSNSLLNEFGFKNEDK
ncbi:MAG: GTPase Era [Oscillospiraceae bacterium]|nr:GTPase Era [Oscillospiraceae bacterium]